MIVHTDFSAFKTDVPLVVTIGTFDGVHLGHHAIIDRLSSVAQSCGGETALLTFYPHPRMVLHPADHELKLLNSPQEKAALLEKAGVQHLMIYPFSEEFSRLAAENYVRNLLVNGLKAHTVIVGYDHRFGRNREGDFSTLKEMSELFGFQVEEIPARDIDTVHISSTKIRQALEEGQLSHANKLLGYHYTLQGTVIHGDARGRTIGFPTANLQVNYPYKLIPAHGVYAIRAILHEQIYSGVLNIGLRPTVDPAGQLRIEAHLFSFDQMIYGENLRIELVERIREERKFSSVQDLQAQIALDIQTARMLL